MNGARTPAARRAVIVALAGVSFAAAIPGAASAQSARDPMRPPTPAAGRAPSTPVPEPVLTAVIGSDAGRRAVVDGRVVRAGERIDDLLILAVLDDGVRYRRAGIVRELRLPAAVAVRRPAGPAPAGPGSDR